MTTKQRREHKAGNAIRRAAILRMARSGSKSAKAFWSWLRVGQKGKHGQY